MNEAKIIKWKQSYTRTNEIFFDFSISVATKPSNDVALISNCNLNLFPLCDEKLLSFFFLPPHTTRCKGRMLNRFFYISNRNFPRVFVVGGFFTAPFFSPLKFALIFLFHWMEKFPSSSSLLLRVSGVWGSYTLHAL